MCQIRLVSANRRILRNMNNEAESEKNTHEQKNTSGKGKKL